MEPRFRNFPKDFFWGASTSAHQVEGNNHNDWSRWENANATRLAREAPKRLGHLENWEVIKKAATDRNNYISGEACDFYNRYADDFDLAKKIGLNAFRLSIEWSRIQPSENEIDKKAIEHYRKMIKALKARGIEPFVTIWHWPLPLWLSQRGGWTYKEISHYYIGYAALLVREFGADVKYWITLNEPNVFTENSYFIGRWPPQRRSLGAYYSAVSNMVKAHREAYHIIKSIDPEAQIGISNNFIPYTAYKHLWINRLLKAYADVRWNYTVLFQIKNHLDFIGVNHYFRYRINYGFNKTSSAPRSDMGWELYPPALYTALKDLRKYKLPIFITESGVADKDDRYRGWYIRETLKHVHRAISHGVDVRGYFHWSLLDNFEWSEGFWPRFGLIEVDYATQKRTVRRSANVYSDIIKHNGLRDLTG